MLLQARILAETGRISHGFFTREGGVSGGIYASLNCGMGSKDARADVIENRGRVAARLGVAPGALVSPFQTHSADVVTATRPWEWANAPRADAVVTREPGLAIGVSTADCVPVLFADPEARVIGAVHAGWRGALSGVIESAVGGMEALGAKRGRIRCAIGPAIQQPSYEVGEEFEARFLAADKANAHYFSRPRPEARPHFDLSGYVADRLGAAGLENIENLGVCTYQSENRLFSYRRSVHRGENDYGRQISAIVIT